MRGIPQLKQITHPPKKNKKRNRKSAYVSARPKLVHSISARHPRPRGWLHFTPGARSEEESQTDYYPFSLFIFSLLFFLFLPPHYRPKVTSTIPSTVQARQWCAIGAT